MNISEEQKNYKQKQGTLRLMAKRFLEKKILEVNDE